jgi:DNA repair exonuclease SbcCD nuclease subunit
MATDFIFISANDIHISDQNPRARIDDYKEAILGKIGQMRMACSKLNADAALIAGDLFNFKSPAKNSHRLNQELIKEFKQFPCPIYMIEGNHDLTANRLESLEDQPLGVLFADKTLRQLRHEVIEKGGLKISLVGIPYEENLDLEGLKIPENKGYVSQICLMHIYASLNSGKMYNERLYGYDELAKLSPDIFVIGHYHIDQGTYETSGKHFINLGSMSRGTLTEDSILHQPHIGFIKISIDDEGAKSILVRPIKLKIKPASEVFDLVKKEEEKKESVEMQVFVDKLSVEATKVSTEKSGEVTDLLAGMDLAKIIRERTLYYIQEARLAKKT